MVALLSACGPAASTKSSTNTTSAPTSSTAIPPESTTTVDPGSLNLTNADNGGSFQVQIGEHVYVELTPDPARWASIGVSVPGTVLQQIDQTSTPSGAAAASFLVVQVGDAEITGTRETACGSGFTGGCASPAQFYLTVSASP